MTKPISVNWAQDPRKVFEGILHVLRTSCQWKALAKSDFGSANAVHKYFLEWKAAGLFEQLWCASLLAYDELEGIDCEWQSLDGIIVERPGEDPPPQNLCLDAGYVGETAQREIKERGYIPHVRPRGEEISKMDRSYLGLLMLAASVIVLRKINRKDQRNIIYG